MKRIRAGETWFAVLTCCLVAACTLSRAEDYESVHRVEPGDIISADMINELFDELEAARRTLVEEDLLGTWTGVSYTMPSGSPYGPEWVRTTSQPYFTELTNVVFTFQKDGGANMLNTTAPSPFCALVAHSAAVTTPFVVKAKRLFVNSYPPYTIDRISRHRIALTRDSVSNGDARLIVLDRQALPPKKPKLLAAEVLGRRDVALRWQDRSENEDGFNVLRRDKLSGVYSNVHTSAANVTTWTNRVPVSGFYWYRIAATNSAGASVGSNVKRVTAR